MRPTGATPESAHRRDPGSPSPPPAPPPPKKNHRPRRGRARACLARPGPGSLARRPAACQQPAARATSGRPPASESSGPPSGIRVRVRGRRRPGGHTRGGGLASAVTAASRSHAHSMRVPPPPSAVRRALSGAQSGTATQRTQRRQRKPSPALNIFRPAGRAQAARGAAHRRAGGGARGGLRRPGAACGPRRGSPPTAGCVPRCSCTRAAGRS